MADGTAELQKLSLISKVTTELENNYNMADETLGSSLLPCNPWPAARTAVHEVPLCPLWYEWEGGMGVLCVWGWPLYY